MRNFVLVYVGCNDSNISMYTVTDVHEKKL